MRRYLTKLFSVWQMHWSHKEAFTFEKEDGGAFLWRASLQKKGGTQTVEVDGMDLVLIRDGLMSRDEVYFDRAVLAPLIMPQTK